MATIARDIMTKDPACCTPKTSLDEVARMMVKNNCGEIPVIDANDRVVGVITDRDIVCRVVAEGRNPIGYTAEMCMSHPVITIQETAPFDQIVTTMEKHQIRRIPIVKDGGTCAGIISQADLARKGSEHQIAELVSEISKEGRR